MGPDPIQNLLLNLKLQLLGLPNLAKWGLLTFAGIIILREAITIAWRFPRKPEEPIGELPTPVVAVTPAGAAPQAALPAPDPLAADVLRSREREHRER